VLKSLRIVAASALIALRVPVRLRISRWLNLHAVIPQITGAIEPGPLDTSRVPPMEGLHDLIAQRHVQFFTLAKSARVGGTLFAICLILHKISESPGPVLWVDPSRASARALTRRELQPFFLACPPVAAQAIVDKEHWTGSAMFFRNGAFVKVAGAGSPNELAGFQAEIVVINEGDKAYHTIKGEAPAHELAVVRSKHFRFTRKILENSTPTHEYGPTWKRFLKGSRHFCYLPCPTCGTYQRLTFFREEVEVPFDEDGRMLPAPQTRPEITGQFKFDQARITQRREVEPGKFEDVEIGWDYEKAEAETYYECAKGCRIEHHRLSGMLCRYQWRAHNRNADRAHISAHFWAAYSPFEHWGAIAKKFLLACGNPGALHDFWNSDLGLPFKAVQTAVEESDLTRMVRASPHYLLRTLPFEPIVLTITVDVQGEKQNNPFWYLVMAWGIAWDQPDWPTWGAVIDYGPAMNWETIEEISGIRPDSRGRYNEYGWTNPVTGEVSFHRVSAGLVDSGHAAQKEANVYEFCDRNSHMFSASKGCGAAQMRGEVMRTNSIMEDKVQLLLFWSDFFCQTLYRRIIKDRKELRFLPSNLDAEFIDHLTDEHTVLKNGKMVWEARTKTNHLGDCWKQQEVLAGMIEKERLDGERVARLEADEEAAKAQKKD